VPHGRARAGWIAAGFPLLLALLAMLTWSQHRLAPIPPASLASAGRPRAEAIAPSCALDDSRDTAAIGFAIRSAVVTSVPPSPEHPTLPAWLPRAGPTTKCSGSSRRHRRQAARGYHMMFALNGSDIPSIARWVKVQ
jgi:hypothetical protein